WFLPPLESYPAEPQTQTETQIWLRLSLPPILLMLEAIKMRQWRGGVLDVDVFLRAHVEWFGE
ncbi:hypothetical protein FS842_002140, partial [Serendipita sp. 407]